MSATNAPALIGSTGDSLREALRRALAGLAAAISAARRAGRRHRRRHRRASFPQGASRALPAIRHRRAEHDGGRRRARRRRHAARRHDLRRVLPARDRAGAALHRLRQAQREDRREPSGPRCRTRRRLGAGARGSGRVPRHPRHDRDLARRSDRDGARDQGDARFRRARSICAPDAAPARGCSATITASKSARDKSSATAAT